MTDNDKSKREPSFSIYEFRGWLSKQPEKTFHLTESNSEEIEPEQNDNLIGERVAPRLGVKRLHQQILEHNQEIDQTKLNEVIEDFKEFGGVVTESKDLKFKIKTNLSDFFLPKLYTKLNS